MTTPSKRSATNSSAIGIGTGIIATRDGGLALGLRRPWAIAIRSITDGRAPPYAMMRL